MVVKSNKKERSDFRFTTLEQAAKDEIYSWRKRSATARFLAVGEICDATYALYNPGRKLPRLERVYRFTDATKMLEETDEQ